MAKKIFSKNGRPARIDPDLDEILRKIKEKNDISMRQASKELARIIKNMKGKEFVRKIKF